MGIDELKIDQHKLDEICRKYGVAKLEVFGSFARGDAASSSDLDIMATFDPGKSLGWEFISLQQELEDLFKRPVDLLTRSAVERSPNKYFRRFALRDTERIYEHA